MEKTRFYFHDLQIKDINNDKIIELFGEIAKETGEEDKPRTYIEIDSSKLHIQIVKKEHVDKEIFFYGKLIQSHKTADFKEEKQGELIEIDLDEDSGICQPQRGIIYFVLYLNEEKNERILILEDVPFALNIGGFIKYLVNKLGIGQEDITTKQKLGRDIISIINATGESQMILAKLRFKKNISIDDVKRIGIVEEAMEKLKEKDLDCELIIRWSKKKTEKLKDFVNKFFKIGNISELSTVDYGSFLRTLQFKIDNVAHDKINMKDDIIKYAPPENKEYYFEHEDELYNSVKADFVQKYADGKLNG